jgi:hypothetical protein
MHPLPRDFANGAKQLGPDGPVSVTKQRARRGWLTGHPWKADFNQCTGRQLIGAVDRAGRLVDGKSSGLAPFVLIGHSKLFTPANERGLERFLRYAASRKQEMRFATFGEASDSLRNLN